MSVTTENLMIKPVSYKLKRLLDLIISLTILVIFSPLLLLIAILIKLDSEGPVLFKQTRIGLDSKSFTIYKFRTMLISAPAYMPTNLLENPADHLTRVGRILRKTSLDELPQLFNIIQNDMSLIGPRPVIPIEKELIELRRKLGVDQILPGVTGLAQIKGRDDLEFEEKAKLDLEYKNNMSFKFDLWIIFMTAVEIIRHEHISH